MGGLKFLNQRGLLIFQSLLRLLPKLEQNVRVIMASTFFQCFAHPVSLNSVESAVSIMFTHDL
jgi:hypothetical protein